MLHSRPKGHSENQGNSINGTSLLATASLVLLLRGHYYLKKGTLFPPPCPLSPIHLIPTSSVALLYSSWAFSVPQFKIANVLKSESLKWLEMHQKCCKVANVFVRVS